MYTTGKPLKEGSDSKVYLATHKTEDKIYAAKIISCEPKDTVKPYYLLKKVNKLKKMRHEHILSFKSFFNYQE